MASSIYKRYVPCGSPQGEDSELAWMFVFSNNKVLMKVNNDNIEIPQRRDFKGTDMEFINSQYLGKLDDYPCLCMEVEGDIDVPDGMDFRDLRSLLGLMEDDIFLLTGRALQIVSWNRMNKYCGRCGSLTQTKNGERAKVCLNCGSVFYPRISPAVIVAITRGDKILLAHNRNFAEKRYSVIAGFVEPGETFEDCVKREVMEEVGIKIKNIKYFDSQPWPFPDSIMVGFTAEYESGEITPDGVEIEDANWFGKDELPNTPALYSIAGRLIRWFVENNK